MVNHCESNITIYHINCVSQSYQKNKINKNKNCVSQNNNNNNNNHINCEKDNKIIM